MADPTSAHPPPLAVVVATRDRPALIERAVEALIHFRRPADEILIVDSASRDPAVAGIVRRAGLEVLRLERPGASRARNAGMRATGAPIVAYIDDDCLVTEGWADGIERAFRDPRLGFVTGRVLPDRDSKLPISVVTEETPGRFERLEDPVAFGGGANMAFRRDAFERVGGFDEYMGPATRMHAAEDQDVFWRLVRAGWAGAYEPSITVVHQQWRTTGEAVRRQFAYGIGSGAFAAKVRRLEPEQGWTMLRSRLWSDGLKQGWRALRQGYETGAASGLMRTAGVLVGAVRGMTTPLDDGHFRR